MTSILLSVFSKGKPEHSPWWLPCKKFAVETSASRLTPSSPGSCVTYDLSLTLSWKPKLPPPKDTIGQRLPIPFLEQICMCLLLWRGHWADCFPRKSLTIKRKSLNAFGGVIHPPLNPVPKSQVELAPGSSGKESRLVLGSCTHPDSLQNSLTLSRVPSCSLPTAWAPYPEHAPQRHWSLTHLRAPSPEVWGCF